jgi:voltage-gated potassium channel
MDAERRKRAFEALERATELPMLVLALAIIPLIAVPLLVDLPPAMDEAMIAVDWTIWAAFALELMVKTYLSQRRVEYVMHHWYDVVIVVVPFLRPLRIVRSARALRLGRFARVGAFLFRSGASLRMLMARHGLQYMLLVGLVIFFASAGGVMVIERGSGGPISDFETALWWAVSTITTVGYGDAYPTTAEGRGVAVLLMLVGIGLFSVLTANVAALLVQSDQDKREDNASLSDLVAEVGRLRGEIASLRADLAAASERG